MALNWVIFFVFRLLFTRKSVLRIEIRRLLALMKQIDYDGLWQLLDILRS